MTTIHCGDVPAHGQATVRLASIRFIPVQRQLNECGYIGSVITKGFHAMRISVWRESPFCVADRIYPCYAGGKENLRQQFGRAVLDFVGGSEVSAIIEV